MKKIEFLSKLVKINSVNIVPVPERESKKLPSRGIVMVEGKIEDTSFRTVLEPDGKGSHFLLLDKKLLSKLKGQEGDTLSVSFEVSDDWIEPQVPDDLKNAIEGNKEAKDIWNVTTPIARWDWIRWVRSTKNDETRQKRILVACSKMSKGEKRPCCFNRSMCTLPDISKSGVLLA